MRMAFYGSSLLSTHSNGAAGYYRGLLRALAARGHRITFLEPDARGRGRHRDMAPPDWAKVIVWEPTPDGLRGALAHAGEVDVVVKASHVGVFDDELAEGVLVRAHYAARVIYWDVDAPATLARLELDPDAVLHRLLSAYDGVFTYGGGERVVGAFRRFGARACIPIFNALDPDAHFPVPRDRRLASDLAFVGNRLPDRERPVADYFLRAADLAPEAAFLLGGSGWDDKAVPRNIRRIGQVAADRQNALNSSARLVLNVSRKDVAASALSPATRVFEAAGAGACLVTDAWEGIERFLEPQQEILVAQNGAGVADFLRTIDRGEAARIGRRARERVLAQHTYDHRAIELEAAVHHLGATTALA